MDDTILPAEWLYRVKAATRDLVRKAGTLERAARICGFGKSTVDRWGSTSHSDLIPIAAALLLEREAGEPLVTQAMAEIHGMQIAPAPGGSDGGSFVAAHIRLAQAMGDLGAEVAAATADGVITPAEAKRIDRKLAGLQSAAAEKREIMAGAAAAAIDITTRRAR